MRGAIARPGMCPLCGEPREGRGWCRACKRQYVKGHRPRHVELAPHARAKAAARSYLYTYIRRGKVKRRRCIYCRRSDTTPLQPDVSRPLDVAWLCPTHREDVQTGRRLLLLTA
jgi:hypothetical protein